jgi:glutamine amidotransferase
VNAGNAVRVVLVDAGGANFHSVQSAFERLGVQACVSSDRGRIAEATHLVLPGVGAAAAAMQRLRAARLDDFLPETTQPLLGICLGMQMLYERSEEGGTTCLGLLPGSVRRLRAAPGRRVPHMGWNRLRACGDDPLGAGLDGEYAYFVHGYAAPAEPGSAAVAECEHGERFAALVARGRLCGAQFHPERSARVGARLLQNFLERSA